MPEDFSLSILYRNFEIRVQSKTILQATTDQEIYIPESATKILLAKGNLTPGQITYLEKDTVKPSESHALEQPAVDTTATETSSGASEQNTIKGRTTFGELIAWSVPQPVIEDLIGAPMPDAAMTLKDYAATKGPNFETPKPELQAEADKIKP